MTRLTDQPSEHACDHLGLLAPIEMTSSSYSTRVPIQATDSVASGKLEPYDLHFIQFSG